MNNRMHVLLSSTAYQNKGAEALAAYKQTPDGKPLLDAARRAAAGDTVDGDDLLRRAPDIAEMLPYWDKVDAIIEGYDAVKKAGDDYLPKFENETNDAYNVRLNLTKLTNIYSDIIDSLSAKPFEEEISIVDESIPEQIKDFIEDVDGEGNNITVFASSYFYNAINSSIDWLFVDYPTVDTEQIKTMKDQKAANIKPFWSRVLARNVLEVRTKKVGGKTVLSYIRILEPGVSEPDRVRIFQLSDNNRVDWELWVKIENTKAGKSQFQLENTGFLSISVIPLVPLVTGRRQGSTWKIRPVMRDAADLQIDLYQQESALKFISTMSGYPMLAANGMRPEMQADGKTPKKINVGPMIILWGIPDGNGNHGEWKFVQPDAAILTFLEEKIKGTKEDLRELGKQPLTAQSGNITTITAGVAAGKSRSTVSAWTLALKDALENALWITAMYYKLDYEAQVNVYNEFDNFIDGGEDLNALSSARQNGDLSRETYWSELKRRKVLSPEFDAEDEEERLLNEIPGDPDIENEDDNSNPERQPGNAV